jgi:hypothetical protein
MTAKPKWYTPITVIALLWNLLGCVAYLSDVMMTPDDVAQLSESQQALYAARTAWSVSATAIAVWCRAAGSPGLILCKRWAMPFLIASLVGLIIQDFGLFFLTGAAQSAGPAAFIIQGLVLLIAVGLVVLSRKAVLRGWIPANVSQQE